MRSPSKGLTIIVTVVLVFICTFDFSLLRGLVWDLFSSKIKKNFQLDIDFKSSSVSGLGFELKDVSLRPNHFPFDLTLNTLNFNCPVNILWGNLSKCQILFSINQGAGKLIFTDRNNLSGDIKAVEISKFAFLSAHNIESGILHIADLKLNIDQKFTHLAAKLKLVNFLKTKPSNLAPSVTGLPLTLKLDPININNAHADIKFTWDIQSKQTRELLIDQIEMTSDMGSISESSSIYFSLHKLQKLDIYFNPSAAGLNAIKPFAQFVCPAESLSIATPLRFSLIGHQLSCQIATN